MPVVAKANVDGKEFDVRHDYLHRGTNPRLVLNVKEQKQFVFLQLDKWDFWDDVLKEDTEYIGYWCTKSGFTQVTIKLIFHK